MKYIICDNIILKDISEEEYYERSNAQEREAPIWGLIESLEQSPQSEKFSDASRLMTDMIISMRHNVRAFGLFDGENYIGYVALSKTNTPIPEIHIELCEEYRRRGIGTRALRLLIKEAFRNERNDFLVYHVHSENVAGIALAKKCGGVFVEKDSFHDFDRCYHFYRSTK
ncbi:MAG: GNAT family N-acetyltransferase [Ruminococcaceae bacterium]|nr:GNAT family N-acetyltransferase [Oscillospiraceae bacterium]